MKITNNNQTTPVLNKRDAAIESVGEFYESQFVKLMLDEMEKSSQNELLGSSTGEKIFKDMLNSQYAEDIAKGKDSVGIKELIIKDLKSKIYR